MYVHIRLELATTYEHDMQVLYNHTAMYITRNDCYCVTVQHNCGTVCICGQSL